MGEGGPGEGLGVPPCMRISQSPSLAGVLTLCAPITTDSTSRESTVPCAHHRQHHGPADQPCMCTTITNIVSWGQPLHAHIAVNTGLLMF